MRGTHVALVISFLGCSPSCSPEHHRAPTQQAAASFDPASLGALTFALTEGTPEAREHFRRGLLALHSFWYDEAQRAFQAALAADPTFNMAHWGLAMSHIKLLWGEDDVAAARQALGTMPDPEKLDERAQAWVLALIALLKAPDVRAGRLAFVAALEQLHRQFPDDESATFLAIGLLSTLRPGAPDEASLRTRAATLARDVYSRNPRHPGAAHYVIHALDTPALAGGALDVARTYARIAPAAFHARHMPAHIFAQHGMWRDAITSCEAAWNASLAAARTHSLSANHHDWHSVSWLVDLPFELGQQAEASVWLGRWADAIRGGLGRQFRGLYATTVASYMARTGEWSRVDELLAPLAAPPREERAVLGGTRCGTTGAPSSPAEVDEQLRVLDTRALAAARRGDVEQTTRLLGELEATFRLLEPTLRATQPDIVDALVTEHRRRIDVLRATARGDDRALVALLRASPPEALAGSERNPSAFVPDEQLGDALLRLGDATGALQAYSQALADHPGRARALRGVAAARAALPAP